jgi:8-oxo-dGTP pyrophosphatase MutT (NUDIX family)
VKFDPSIQHYAYRVAGVLLHKGRILFQQDPKDLYWVLPGGSVEFGEQSDSALVREMREELDASVRVVRPLWLMENFFELCGKRWHETGLYFLMEFEKPENRYQSVEQFSGVEFFSNFIPGKTINMEFRWISPKDFPLTEIKPFILREHLRNIPDQFTRIVNTD